MPLSAQSLLRRVSLGVLRRYTTAAEAAPAPEVPVDPFRTTENNPINHDRRHLNRFYSMSDEVRKKLFSNGGMPMNFLTQLDTFVENCIMIREPAVEIISCLKHTDYSRPINKYVLYGEVGSGKTVTAAHLLHYGFEAKKVLVHLGWVPDWFRRPKEITTSARKEGFYDLPLDAANFLAHFKNQNTPLLSELDLRLSKDYKWSIREQSPKGSPLLDLIDLGISRIKFACDIVDALFVELKTLSTAGHCNCLVVIDGFNAFMGMDSELRIENRKLIYPNQITLTESILNLTKYDWCNGAVVLIIDQLAVHKEKYDSFLPRYLLGKEGFEHLDPFLPVHVENYTRDEFESVMDYYRNRKWIRDVTKDGQRELELLSARNPYLLMKLTAPL